MIYAAGLCSDLISFCNNISSTSFYLCNPMCIKLSYYCTSSVSNYKSLQLFESQTIYIFDQNYRKDYNSERRVLIRVVDYIQTLIFCGRLSTNLAFPFFTSLPSMPLHYLVTLLVIARKIDYLTAAS